MAGSESSRLTKEQLEVLRRRLEDERSRILRVLQALPSTSQTDEGTDIEEAAQRETELSHADELAASERALLAEVERALAKLDTGTYGRSEQTGEPIPFERLTVVPWARQAIDD